MADELDPILERSLADVLRAEADALPFTLRADTLRRVRGERHRARRAARLSWIAAAAIVIVAVVGVATLSTLGTPNRIASPTTPGLPSFEQLRARGLGGPEIARYEGTAGTIESQWQQGVSSKRASVEIVIACIGPGQVTVSTTGMQVWPVGTTACNGEPVSLRDGADPNLASADSPTIMVQAPAGTVFRYVVLGAPGSTPDAALQTEPTDPSAMTAAALPSDAALLAAAGQNAVVLASAFGDARPQREVVAFSPVPHRGGLAVVIVCRGDGSVGVAFADSTLPSSDPGGSDSAFAYNPATCDGAPHVVPWDGWNAAPDFMASGPNVGLSVPSGIGYRAILVDTSALASDGETTPVAEGVPTFDHLSAIHSDRQGDIVATHEELSPPSGASSPIQAADIRADDAIKVLVGCVGGTADLTLGNMTGDSATTIGNPVCDGTVQEFDAATVVAGGTHAASLLVTVSAGTTWRLIVRDMTSTPHPHPTVPCGSASGLKRAPLPTLYAGGKAIGTLPGYYTSLWGTTADEGVPFTPSASTDVKANTPLQLRVAGDVCAADWTIIYGTPRAGGLGIDPVGALALLGKGFVTTQASSENRIDLQTLPPGDWVLAITLGFENGSGTGMLRVHAGG